MSRLLTTSSMLDALPKIIKSNANAFNRRDIKALKWALSDDDLRDHMMAHFAIKYMEERFYQEVWDDHLHDFYCHANLPLVGQDKRRILTVDKDGGRIIISLNDRNAGSRRAYYNGAWITFIMNAYKNAFDVNSNNIAYQGLHGTIEDISRLVDDVITIGPRVLVEAR